MPSDVLGAHLDKWGARQEADFEWVQGLMRSFRYKPGWVFQVNRRPETGATMVLVDFHAPNSRNPSVQAKVGGNYYVHPGILESRDAGLFWRWLRRTLADVEDHERDEWFQVEGELMFDPHRGD